MSRGIWFIVLLVAIEVFAFKGLRMLTLAWDPLWRRLVLSLFVLTTLVSFGAFFWMMRNTDRFIELRTYHIFNAVLGLLFTCLIVKALFATFHLADDLVHLVRWATQKMSASSAPAERITRSQFLSQTGALVSGAMLGTIVYGMVRGKYNFRVERSVIAFEDLPPAFDGVRIAHISDLHLGSFNGTFDAVQKGFDIISGLDADYIVFTGDLVNNFSDEAEPWIDRLRALHARSGKFSILGNHDYGDYALGDLPELKAQSFSRLLDIHAEAGFRLLRNEHVALERNGETLYLLGVENWGGRGFSKYGDLAKTMEGIPPGAFRILLSHDPTHWEQQVLRHTGIPLTLSGHTHGAQMGVEIPRAGIKWSPSSLIGYKRWGGLYKEGSQYLYVNRGFGFLAFPTRAGIPPEITLLELRRA
jgi:predicted MPP superfamily phosphohydrolase